MPDEYSGSDASEETVSYKKRLTDRDPIARVTNSPIFVLTWRAAGMLGTALLAIAIWVGNKYVNQLEEQGQELTVQEKRISDNERNQLAVHSTLRDLTKQVGRVTESANQLANQVSVIQFRIDAQRKEIDENKTERRRLERKLER